MLGFFVFVTSAKASEEKIILQTDFSNETISPLEYWGSGNYSLFTPSNDPLGTNSYGVKIWNSPSEGSRGSLVLWTSQKFEYVHIKEVIAMTNISKWQQFLMIRNQKMYQTPYQLAWLENYNQFRIRYFSGGTMYTLPISGVIPEANRKYTVELWLKIGHGDGELRIAFDGITRVNLTNLDNDDRGLADAFEFGTSWGDANVTQYIYSINLTGKEAELVNVTGRIVDVAGNPIAEVGIRVGSPPPKERPWTTGTYFVNIYSDSNGKFSFETLKILIPEIKLIKPGYGDPSEPVGSITRLKNIDLTKVQGNTYDLGDIVLQPRSIVQPSIRPNGTYWPFRSVVIFPYQNSYSSQGYLATLDALKKSFGDRFNVIDLRCYASLNESGMPICDGLYSFSELAAGIKGAHEKGFKVMLSLVGRVNKGDEFSSKWWASYKELLLKMAELGSNHSVEYFTIAFETHPFYYPENDEKKLEILEALKAYLDSHPDWNPKIGYIGVENEANLTQVKQTSGWLLHPLIDYVGIEDWRRKAGILDPTEENISYAWRYGISWDWRPDPPDIYEVYKGIFEFLKKPIIVNFGSGTGDGNCWAPWISGYRPNVQDQEEMALFYKVYFDHMQNLPFYGVAMEHYSFAPSNTTITGCFRETIAEEFIKVGLDAHSKNFSMIIGRIKDKYENPLKASIYAFKKGTEIIADSSRTDKDGNYRIELTPDFYDVSYNVSGTLIKLLSLNVTSNLYNPINYPTKTPTTFSFVFNGTGSQTIQLYSEKKPSNIKINGTTITSWNYNETSKLLTISFSC
ncbi:MAG: hypothetical protein QW403_03265 [Candidatus Aenigmatarchaeota archaeon]